MQGDHQLFRMHSLVRTHTIYQEPIHILSIPCLSYWPPRQFDSTNETLKDVKEWWSFPSIEVVTETHWLKANTLCICGYVLQA